MRRVHLMAFLLAALPHSAHAQDYPFTGAFTAAAAPMRPTPMIPPAAPWRFSRKAHRAHTSTMLLI